MLPISKLLGLIKSNLLKIIKKIHITVVKKILCKIKTINNRQKIFWQLNLLKKEFAEKNLINMRETSLNHFGCIKWFQFRDAIMIRIKNLRSRNRKNVYPFPHH